MQIIRRKRLGNDTEDIDSFSIQLRSSNVAIMDGYDVLSAPLIPGPLSPIAEPATVGGSLAVRTAITPLTGPTPAPTTRLFDVLSLAIKASPRGIAQFESKNLFVFNDPAQTGKLFLADGRGVPHGTIDIQYPGGDLPQAVEGISYIPKSSPLFPDHLVMVTSFPDPSTDIQARLAIINFNGQVAREIVPQGELAATFLTGVCFKSPSSLLVSSDDDETIYELDFKGNIIQSLDGGRIQPPTKPPVLHGIEGLLQTADGRIAAAGGFDGFLLLFDLRNDLPPQTIDYRIGLGLSLPAGLAWDSSRDQFLINSFDRVRPDSRFISSLAPLFTGFRPIKTADNLTQKLAFLPDEQLIAATHLNNPRGILLFNEQGQPAGTVDTSGFGAPRGLGYIPTTREFVLAFRDPNDASIARKLFVLARDGALSRIIDLTAAGVTRVAAVAFFNPQHPSGGQFLVIDGQDNMGIVTDFTGTKLDKFSIRETLKLLNPIDVTAITSGSDAGALAIANAENSEVVVFRLN